MFKNGNDSIKICKKQIEVNVTVNQNTENERKCKLKRERKKTKKSEVEKIPLEANDVEVCRKLKKMKKKKKSRRSSISDEEQGAKIERKIAKGHPQESEVDEDSYHLKHKKKRRKSFLIDEHSGPESTSEKGKRNISKDDPSRVQVKSERNIKKKKKINLEISDVEKGFTKSRKMSYGTADKLGNTTEVSCVVSARSVKRKKKKKHFHSEDFDISGNEKSLKKWQRDINTSELEAGNDKSNQAYTKKQKDVQILDTLEKKCMKKKKKHKLHTGEPEGVHKGEMVKKRQGVDQIENDVEYVLKSHRKRKRSAETEGIETNLNKTNNICKFQDSPETVEGKKLETPFDILEESVKIKMKIKRMKKEASSVMQIKEELCNNDDLQFMSERKGNLFEVTIDKARRQALQEEIDKLSGKTGTSESEASPEMKPRCTGTQWDTATFESTEQKNKFLRLMGGFKSSNQPPSSGSTGKQNMALNKEQEQNFNRTLQKEFDKALNLRQHRGIGLGFQPFSNPVNKTFFIDKYASKSTKFNFS